MNDQQADDERQVLVDESGWDSDQNSPLRLSKLNKARLLSFFYQYGQNLNHVADITKFSYRVVNRIDVMDAAACWAITNVDNTNQLHVRLFTYVVSRSYEYLTAINLSYVSEFENATIYNEEHKCEVVDRNRPFEGNFQETNMLGALSTCVHLEKMSMCTCLVPRYRDEDLASIFKATKKLAHLRLMSFRFSGQSLLSLSNPENMTTLFLTTCWMNRKYLLRGLRRMKRLNLLSLKSSVASEEEYSPAKMQISKLMKRMRLDWFEMLSDYLPLYLFEKRRLNCLTVLSVDYAGASIDDHAIKYIADNCKILKVFSSKECWNVTSEGFVPIFRLTRLRYIDVSSTNVTDLAVQERVSRDLRVFICRRCRFTSNGLKTLMRQLDKIKVVDAFECNAVDDEFVGFVLAYSNDGLDHLLTVRVASTGVTLQRVRFAVPIPNLKLITETHEQLDVDYRDHLTDRRLRDRFGR